MRTSLLIHLALMAWVVLVRLVLSAFPVKVVVAAQEEVFAWPLIAGLTIAGAASVVLGARVGLPAHWDAAIPARQRLLLPALAGLAAGVVPFALDALTGFVDILAAAAKTPRIHVAFPASLLFYSAGAIVLETAYRLVLLTVPVWLIGNVLLQGRGRAVVFWIVAVLVSALEPAAQMSLVPGHAALMTAVGVLAFAVNLFEAGLMRRCGFLAPVAFRVSYYLVWHVGGSALS